MKLGSTPWQIGQLNIRANVVRENDRARLGIDTAFVSAESDYVEVAANIEVEQGERLQLNCENQLQHFHKRIEGIAASVTAASQPGIWIVGIEPRLRLTPAEVRLLKPRKPPYVAAHSEEADSN